MSKADSHVGHSTYFAPMYVFTPLAPPTVSVLCTVVQLYSSPPLILTVHILSSSNFPFGLPCQENQRTYIKALLAIKPVSQPIWQPQVEAPDSKMSMSAMDSIIMPTLLTVYKSSFRLLLNHPVTLLPDILLLNRPVTLLLNHPVTQLPDIPLLNRPVTLLLNHPVTLLLNCPVTLAVNCRRRVSRGSAEHCLQQPKEQRSCGGKLQNRI